MFVKEARVQPPALETFPDAPLYNTKAVVHQTGVPAPTLRAWERRYGILAPRRGENDYRLYSERDIATVGWLRERVEGGMTISQAIALLRSLEPARRRGRKGGQVAAPAQAASAAAPPAMLAMLALDDMRAALVQGFAALDEPSASRILAQALAVHTVEDVCLGLLTPVLVEIGRQWADGAMAVTVEHFASAVVRARLENLYHVTGDAQAGPLALVGCAPGELHEIGALMLALFLRRAGLRVAYLGQNIEPEGLLRTIAAVKPAAVLLSATLPAHAERLIEVAEAARADHRPRPQLLFGGQGFAAAPELARRAEGHYLPLGALDAVREIRRRLAA